MIKIRASDFGGGPVTFRYNWPSRPVEILVLALPLILATGDEHLVRTALDLEPIIVVLYTK